MATSTVLLVSKYANLAAREHARGMVRYAEARGAIADRIYWLSVLAARSEWLGEQP